MTISSKDFKNICNYSDKQLNSPNAQLMYVDIFSSEDEDYKQMVKQQNRELVVDAILDGKVKELDSFRENQPVNVSSQYNQTNFGGTNYPTITPKIMKINLTAKKFLSYEKLWNEIIDFLNQNTQSPKTKSIGKITSLDVSLQGDLQIDYRKVITKIMMCSNLIAIEGRLGPAVSLIYGKKTFELLGSDFNYNNNNLLAYYSDLIDDDKIIVCRGNNIDQPGLLLVDNSTSGNYFFQQTPNWNKQYCWFRVI